MWILGIDPLQLPAQNLLLENELEKKNENKNPLPKIDAAYHRDSENQYADMLTFYARQNAF